MAKAHLTLRERLLAKVIPVTESGCWLWMGAIDKKGYGCVHSSRSRRAHRVMYESVKGPVPHGFELDHLCRVPSCVNPDHLEPVTHKENVLRGKAAMRRNPMACPAGHPYTAENTYHTAKGSPTCRECNRISTQNRRDLGLVQKRKSRSKFIAQGQIS